MKLIYLFIVLLLCTSVLLQTNERRIILSELIGEWRMCRRGNVNSNVCTDIIFKKNKKGMVIYPNKEKLKFTFRLSDGVISVHEKKSVKFFCGETKFDCILEETKGIFMLTLLSKTKGIESLYLKRIASKNVK